jgi:phosphate-selective porin/polyhydroxyalkanoate synthesis regulator phasin
MNYKIRSLVAAALTGSVLMGASTTAAADSTTDIVNALVTKGVLTEEEGALLTKGRTSEVETQKKKEKKAWTNNINIRGYVQNRVTDMVSGDEGVVLWPDPSVGDDRSGDGRGQNFRIRRARIIFSGQIGDHLGFYIQPDFASTAGTTGNITQLRDAYGDIFIDKDKVHRFRVGQSKVPFGYENLQSSSNRLALDRVDALNSAVRDERDTGVFYYYTPKDVQDLFKEIDSLGLKHSGNYGMFGAGMYMGQGANQNDQNDNYHSVARFTYPWKTESGQIFEAGIQAYAGRYVRSAGSYRRANAAGVLGGATPFIDAKYRNGFDDERVAVSFRMYPQPWGLEGEWNWGTSPGLDMDSGPIVSGRRQGEIKNQSLHGGYIQGSYFAKDVRVFDTNIGNLIPFVKWQYYDGFNKAETNAPKNNVNDWEMGVEWQIAPEVELAAIYHRMKRTNMTTSGEFNDLNGSYGTFNAEALRVQLQYNFF